MTERTLYAGTESVGSNVKSMTRRGREHGQHRAEERKFLRECGSFFIGEIVGYTDE